MIPKGGFVKEETSPLGVVPHFRRPVIIASHFLADVAMSLRTCVRSWMKLQKRELGNHDTVKSFIGGLQVPSVGLPSPHLVRRQSAWRVIRRQTG